MNRYFPYAPVPMAAVEQYGYLGGLEIPAGYSGVMDDEGKESVFSETGCTPSVRFRGRFGSRVLSVWGPKSQLNRAVDLAYEWMISRPMHTRRGLLLMFSYMGEGAGNGNGGRT